MYGAALEPAAASLHSCLTGVLFAGCTRSTSWLLHMLAVDAHGRWKQPGKPRVRSPAWGHAHDLSDLRVLLGVLAVALTNEVPRCMYEPGRTLSASDSASA